MATISWSTLGGCIFEVREDAAFAKFAYNGYIYIYTSWWFHNYFSFSSRKLAKMKPFWLISFRGVETTNQYTFYFWWGFVCWGCLWRCWKGDMLTKKNTVRWMCSRFQYWFSNLKGTCDSMSKSPSAAVVSHLYNDGYCSADDAGVVVSVNWWIVFHCRCWIGLVWIPTSTLRKGYFTCMHCFVSNFIVGDLGMIFIVYIFDCASNDSMIG